MPSEAEIDQIIARWGGKSEAELRASMYVQFLEKGSVRIQ